MGTGPNQLHSTTDGHPLWINLILMQAVRHGQRLRGVLDLVKGGGSTLPSTTRGIWNQLSKQQKNVLLTMAELDRPEPESHLVEFLPGLNANRVNRALKTLRSFYLIETRPRPAGDPVLGLHPIIKEFIRTNYPRREREKHVIAILDYLDRMMGRFRGLLAKEPSYEILEYWVRKADLQINFGKFEEATNVISEISTALINRGYVEDFIRVVVRLVEECDLAEACASYRGFDGIFEQCVSNMIQMGHPKVDPILRRYESAVPGKGTQHILVCDLRCYSEWYQENYDAAIGWGEEGERLKALTPIDTEFSTKHNLALARRDRGRLDEALQAFLDGETLDVVVNEGGGLQDKSAAFFGNVGRCLFLMNELERAIRVYITSARILERSQDHIDSLNRGYIRYWIAELLERKGELESSAAFYRCAVCTWKSCSPPRSTEAEAKLKSLAIAHPELSVYLVASHLTVEGLFRDWLDQSNRIT